MHALMALYAQLAALQSNTRAEQNPIKKIAIGFILMAIALVVALVVLPVVADSVAAAQASTNVTGSEDTMLDLIPLLVIVGLVLGSLAFLVSGFKDLKG